MSQTIELIPNPKNYSTDLEGASTMCSLAIKNHLPVMNICDLAREMNDQDPLRHRLGVQSSLTSTFSLGVPIRNIRLIMI